MPGPEMPCGRYGGVPTYERERRQPKSNLPRLRLLYAPLRQYGQIRASSRQN